MGRPHGSGPVAQDPTRVALTRPRTRFLQAIATGIRQRIVADLVDTGWTCYEGLHIVTRIPKYNVEGLTWWKVKGGLASSRFSSTVVAHSC